MTAKVTWTNSPDRSRRGLKVDKSASAAPRLPEFASVRRLLDRQTHVDLRPAQHQDAHRAMGRCTRGASAWPHTPKAPALMP